MQKELFKISPKYESTVRAVEAIWKCVYIMGFEVMKESETELIFGKNSLFGMIPRMLKFSVLDDVVFLESSPRDFYKVRRILK